MLCAFAETCPNLASKAILPASTAILNALAMATDGHRFTQLPVKNTHILEALA